MPAIAWTGWLVPKLSESVGGTTFKERTAAGPTVRLVDPVIVPALAVILAVPIADATAPPVGLTLAIAAADDVHVALCVRSWVVPSENFPVAVSWRDSPKGKAGCAGVTVMLTNAAGPTVTVVLPVIPWESADTCAGPSVNPVTLPCVSTETIAERLVCHIGATSKGRVIPSSKSPVAVSFTDVPLAIGGSVGATSISFSFGADILPPPQLMSNPLPRNKVKKLTARGMAQNRMMNFRDSNVGDFQWGISLLELYKRD
jgi:hypothetical protein